MTALPLGIVLAVLVASGLRGQEPPADGGFDPTSAYEPEVVHGWTVLVNRRLHEAPEGLALEVRAVLGAQLHQVARVVPAEPLAELRKIRIWVERDDPRKHVKCMCYHPSAEWLKAHGFNPEKAGGVELGHAENFLAWTREQPWMVLHELAHGYHHRVLGHGHAGVLAAFAKAKEGGRYESVLHANGRKQRHYALTGIEEYFAEGTEAFFGTNDFFPFVRAELREHDAPLENLLAEVWKARK